MFESPELVLCHKTERVTIFKIPPLSTTKGYYLDDWKDMIWEGGVKVTEKDKIITITFIAKDGKIFAQTKIVSDPEQSVKKTKDSSRGYAVRLQKPNGGYLWIGVAFRDRDDAFDFGVLFQDFKDRKKLDSNSAALEEQFDKKADFSLKKGEKIKISIGKKDNDAFNDFGKEEKAKKSADVDWFGDFGTKTEKPQEKQKQKKKKQPQKNDFNLLDL